MINMSKKNRTTNSKPYKTSSMALKDALHIHFPLNWNSVRILDTYFPMGLKSEKHQLYAKG